MIVQIISLFINLALKNVSTTVFLNILFPQITIALSNVHQECYEVLEFVYSPNSVILLVMIAFKNKIQTSAKAVHQSL